MTQESQELRAQFSAIDQKAGTAESLDETERFVQKLEVIYRDPDLAPELGVLIRDLVLIPRMNRREITHQQYDRVMEAYDEYFKSVLTPEQLAQAEEEAKGYMARYGDRPSPFAGR